MCIDNLKTFNLISYKLKMNVLKERRKRRTERNSGGSAESPGSYYGSQNTNDFNSISIIVCL
jgi:hypothetical protein